MNRKPYAGILTFTCLALAFWTACGSNSGSPRESIAETSGSAQSSPTNLPFAAPLVATVTEGATPMGGVVVTFTAPTTGASGTFAGGVNTATTNASGVATSAVFTPNSTTGAYTVTAATPGTATPANFSMTNAGAVATTRSYVFSLSGLESADYGPNYYALVGAVTINPSGIVLGGVQDFNDAEGDGYTSPQPSGDMIVGGSLEVDPTTGLGTLVLVTNNANLGTSGTETLGVAFANTGHALINQFDNASTASGSMDLQTLPSTLSGGYAFTLSGIDGYYVPVVFGGVFSITGTTLTDGVYDVNDVGNVTLKTLFTGTVSAANSFGRGTITGTQLAEFGEKDLTLNYYVIGPEAIRIIDVDEWDSAVGSAYGQGGGTFSNASLGSSVFGDEADPWANIFALAGQFTVPASGTFAGVADVQAEISKSAADIGGSYTIASNGYGSFTLKPEVMDVSQFGIYMTDPTLNLNDPNNTTTGLGGALIIDLDEPLIGSGILVPQTDTTAASFTGNYAFGAEGFGFGGCVKKDTAHALEDDCGSIEYDFVGQGSVTSGLLSGTGMLNDPDGFFSDGGIYSGVAFTGTATADDANAGRYTIPLVLTAPELGTADLAVAIYQGSGDILFWINTGEDDLFLGTLQQQQSLSGLNAKKKVWANSKVKP
jgi:hypothetical protein